MTPLQDVSFVTLDALQNEPLMALMFEQEPVNTKKKSESAIPHA